MPGAIYINALGTLVRTSDQEEPGMSKLELDKSRCRRRWQQTCVSDDGPIYYEFHPDTAEFLSTFWHRKGDPYTPDRDRPMLMHAFLSRHVVVDELLKKFCEGTTIEHHYMPSYNSLTGGWVLLDTCPEDSPVLEMFLHETLTFREAHVGALPRSTVRDITTRMMKDHYIRLPEFDGLSAPPDILGVMPAVREILRMPPFPDKEMASIFSHND